MSSAQPAQNAKMGFFICTTLIVMVMSLSALLHFLPYLPRMLSEGKPRATWPAPGHYAEMVGNTESMPATTIAELQLDDAAKLAHLFKQSGGKALIVYHRGKLKLEHYAPGVDRHTRLNSFSLVKSLVGALVIKAVDEKRISLDQSIGSILPAMGGDAFRAIALNDLLHMRSGLQFEPTDLASNGGQNAIRSLNPLSSLVRLHFMGPKAILHTFYQTPLSHRPFQYQNINTVLLGMVLEKIYEKSLPQILLEKIWLPAGAGTAYWRKYNATSSVGAYCCLYARPIDWLKVGLFLQANGSALQQFVGRDLWLTYFAHQTSAQQRRYGIYLNHLRHDVLDRPDETLQGPFSYFSGQGGQRVYFMPEQDLIVIRFGDSAQALHSTMYAAWQFIRTKS